ncbi:hypothetical protein QJ043_07075 [Olsenella sp. YH-ols2217]|uniref:C2H2-type domain-containing protein n=1 Tax=Kribbibacterium absianum TaxID=3044210 RepID=A0ABT6ZMH3_9ACTN|nr:MULTISPECIES: hypothetical protein [unclassified Olsenella]MDJ1121828.1 hypothetical protein [Olsenella sp. YH-ols2216]MDJ1129836.1 hypothetical protein [Olsenella sp. YH-ols2217]
MDKTVLNHYFLRSAVEYLAPAYNEIFTPSIDGSFDYRAFSDEVLKECLDPESGAIALSQRFPGRLFFGPFCDAGGSEDRARAIALLRATWEAHKKLQRLARLAFEGGEVPVWRPEVEQKLREGVLAIEGELRECEGLSLERGDGYLEAPEDALPACHLYHWSLEVSGPYSQWLRARVDGLEPLMGVMPAPRVLGMVVSRRLALSEDGQCLEMDVYGRQSLLPDWDAFLDAQDKGLPEDVTLSGYELLAGLTVLLDTVASLHLITSFMAVDFGQPCRSTAQDGLTDFWLRCYEDPRARGCNLGICEVCGHVFVGSSPKQRGHHDCMNRQRVMRSKARKFQRLVDDGMELEEAARAASISPSTAAVLLGQAGGEPRVLASPEG